MKSAYDRIVLITQGSQGVVALRELFAIGIKPESISILTVKSKNNGPFIEFLNFNKLKPDFIDKSADLTKRAKDFDSKALLLSISCPILIPSAVLKRTPFAVNLHPGILPDYKGCFSIPWALINGEKEVGFTYHFMNEKFDEGDIILQKRFKIGAEDTAHSLNYRVFQVALRSLGEVLELSRAGKGKKQAKGGHYYKNALPHGGRIDLSWSRAKVERFIRAMYFPPFTPAIIQIGPDKIEVESMKDFDLAVKRLKKQIRGA